MPSEKFKKLLRDTSKLKEAKKICENAGYAVTAVTESSEILIGQEYYDDENDFYSWEISWKSKDGWSFEYSTDIDWNEKHAEKIKENYYGYYATEEITLSGIDDDGKKFKCKAGYDELEPYGPIVACYIEYFPASRYEPADGEAHWHPYDGRDYEPSCLDFALKKFYGKYDNYPFVVKGDKVYAKSEEELKDFIKKFYDLLN